jgi:hypothetical protein
MREMVHSMVAVMLLFCVFGRAASAQSAAEGSCSLSTFQDGQTASVHGKVAHGAHDLLLVVPGCDKAVVLEYAGNEGSGVSVDKLVRDESFKQFEKYARDTYKKVGKGACVQCPRYEVEATLTGKLDVAPDTVPEGQWKDKLGMLHDQSGKFVGKAGFGHPPIQKYRLIIESVSDVSARELPKPKVPDSEGSRSLLHESGHAQGLEAQP